MCVWGGGTSPQQLLSFVVVVFQYARQEKGVTVDKVRLQERTERGIGVIRSSLRGKQINRK